MVHLRESSFNFATRIFIQVLAASALLSSTLAYADDFVAKNLEDFAYIASETAWKWRLFDPKIINVCWENPSENFKSQMAQVEVAVRSTWQDHSQLRFEGWLNKCGPMYHGIHILISDEGPHTTDLGRKLDGKTNGMVLNFVFSTWSQVCRDQGMYDNCVKSIAVHEFGHAIGFAHEQNRPDTPGECALKAQGPNGDLMLTSWDLGSVMNYCNPVYNNNGMLSAGDIYAVQKLYGAPM